MSQHDFEIANQTASSARSDINNALVALATNNSGNNAPSDTYPNMFWYENDTNILKIRNEDDTGWINFAYIDKGNSRVGPMDNTRLYSSSGLETGLLGDQLTSTWQAGTGTLDSLVSPSQVRAAIEALAPSSSLTLGTFTAASGNTFLDFSVPTTATEIYVNYYDVIPSGGVEVQLKVGGSPVTTGYYSSSGTSGAESGQTDSFYLYAINGRNLTGVMSITKASSTVWMETHASTQNFAENNGAGRLTGAGTVNGVRFKAGTSFSGGQVSVSYR